MKHFMSLLIALCFCGASAYSHPITPMKDAAKVKNLPTKILEELIYTDAKVVIKSTSGGPMYKPGFFYGGTIYLPFASLPPSQWTATHWSNFYNEAFHAWWGLVFLKQDVYRKDRNQLFNSKSLKAKYKEAHYRKPYLAMEEGYSETVASVIIFAYPRIRLNQTTGEYIRQSPNYETLYYQLNHTVAAVSHSDARGYSAKAEEIFPNQFEYNLIMQWLFGKDAPKVPVE